MKMKLPTFLRKRKRAITPPSDQGAHELATQLFQALIYIREHPKHAKRKAKEALAGPKPWRYLYRELLKIQAHPERAAELSGAAVLEAQIAMKLHAALIEIRNKPKEAIELSMVAIDQATKMGSRKT